MNALRIPGPAGSLAVDDGGRGRVAVVLVHSGGGNTTHWSAQLQHLRTTRRAVALDLRGHGQSEPPRNGDYSIEAMAGDVAAVADRLALERFVLVGHSLGGGVALSYAGAHPERVAGLLLVDPIADGSKIPADAVRGFLNGLESSASDSFIQGYWTRIAGADSAVRERLLQDLRATPRETIVQTLKAVMRFDPNPALAGYRGRGPALSIVTPQNDAPFSLHRLGTGMSHKVVTGAGHWLQLERPQEFNHWMDEFLAGIGDSR